MNIREITASQAGQEVVSTNESKAHERLISALYESPRSGRAGESQSTTRLNAVGGADLIEDRTLPFVLIDHQRYQQNNEGAIDRAINCSARKFMHTFFSDFTQEELIVKSYLGGLAVSIAGLAVTPFSPRVGAPLVLGGSAASMFGGFLGLRYLNGIKDYYSQPPNCRIFGGSERRNI